MTPLPFAGDAFAHFARGLPKAELHLHIEGSLEPALMFALAGRNGITLPYADVAAVRAAYAFSNLQSFLDIYYAGAAVLVQRQDFTELALAYFERLAADGGVHAEIFFDPQTHTARGVPFADVIEGLLAGMAEAEARFGVTSKLIMSFLRHLDEASAFATLEEARPYWPRLGGIGLDSSELGNPPEKFARVFAAARAAGFKVMAHAGEEGPPAYVWEALDRLQIDRLDHGNRSLEDDALVRRLTADQMTLTVCPLSNLKLKVVRDMAEHPLKRMLDLGLRATINSDDPAYFGGYLPENYLAAADALALTPADLVVLAKNSFEGSFLSGEEKAAMLARIDGYVLSCGL